MSAEIMKRTPKTGGPGAFKKELARKIAGNYKYSEERVSFIDTTKVKAKDTPGSKYNLNWTMV